MAKEIDFDAIIGKYRSDPYDYIEVAAIHTGVVNFKVQEGDEVDSPSGEWAHIPGSPIYEINRERNPKVVTTQINGTISSLNADLEGKFVEAGEILLTIRHPLKKKEIIENILNHHLTLFHLL